MNKKELFTEILKLKKLQNAIILVHNYQSPDIHEIADFIGDSLDLSKKAANVEEQVIVFCGVNFMAETAKILSPQKQVLLPRYDAGCPMAAMVTVEKVISLKKQYPKAKVVCYVNSTSEVKAVSDVCCTSSNAVKVVENIDADEIIFVPDKNLGSYCQRFTKKKIILWNGFCYVHNRITLNEAREAKKAKPKAVMIVHPECPAEVVDIADETLSTTGMVDFITKSTEKEFLIGTEIGLIQRLQREHPEKCFYSIGSTKSCINMKKITLPDVYYALLKERYKVEVKSEVASGAKKSLDAMLRVV